MAFLLVCIFCSEDWCNPTLSAVNTIAKENVMRHLIISSECIFVVALSVTAVTVMEEGTL